MRIRSAYVLLLTTCCRLAVGAPLEMVAGTAAPQCVFPGPARNISVIFHNPGDRITESDVHARIFQTTSATAVLLSEKPWKKLQVLPGQTVMESAPLEFPAVKAETKFIVQWVEGTNAVIGHTEVVVYPANLLTELKPMAGEAGLGIYDPQNQLKPLLKQLKLDFIDLENSDFENFTGKLAVMGPFQSKEQMGEDFSKRIQAMAKRNAAIVWIQPPPEKRHKLQPSFYSVPEKEIAVVIAQPGLVADLADNPTSQMNLVYLCKLALHPETPSLPFQSR